MNVTLKVHKDILRKTRHRAVDEDLSLSAWMARLLERELAKPSTERPVNLLDQVGDENLADLELPLPARTEPVSRIEW